MIQKKTSLAEYTTRNESELAFRELFYGKWDVHNNHRINTENGIYDGIRPIRKRKNNKMKYSKIFVFSIKCPLESLCPFKQ